jgi:hypothetical protein
LLSAGHALCAARGLFLRAFALLDGCVRSGSWHNEKNGVHGNTLRRAIGIEQAALRKPCRYHLNAHDKTDKDSCLLHNSRLTRRSSRWLRTQVNNPSHAFFVEMGRGVRGCANVSLARDDVRPAFVVDMRRLSWKPSDPT